MVNRKPVKPSILDVVGVGKGERQSQDKPVAADRRHTAGLDTQLALVAHAREGSKNLRVMQ
jgi:hypothetical protein